jgi:hypothetical protein
MRAGRAAVVTSLLASDEPSIRWKVRVRVLGEDPKGRTVRRLQAEVRRSPRVTALVDGVEARRVHPYTKWLGPHWVLAALADLGHPGGPELTPLVDEVLATWLSAGWFRDLGAPPRINSPGVPRIDGRYRRCGSQQGSALLSAVRLGVVDERAEQLAERLQHWQWPDGGWNCDLRPSASSSSVHETLLPMRGLAAYGATAGDDGATAAARRAAEVFLERRLLFHRTDGTLVAADWARLHYPLYWHYDVLGGLKGLAELGLLADERCVPALDLLESKELPDGGWPAQARYYRGVGGQGSGVDHVDWGGVSATRVNPWVSADALTVLASASRF